MYMIMHQGVNRDYLLQRCKTLTQAKRIIASYHNKPWAGLDPILAHDGESVIWDDGIYTSHIYIARKARKAVAA